MFVFSLYIWGVFLVRFVCIKNSLQTSPFRPFTHASFVFYTSDRFRFQSHNSEISVSGTDAVSSQNYPRRTSVEFEILQIRGPSAVSFRCGQPHLKLAVYICNFIQSTNTHKMDVVYQCNIVVEHQILAHLTCLVKRYFLHLFI